MLRKMSEVLAAPIALLLVLNPTSVGADTTDNLKKHHALSLIGEPEYRPDFTHFKWVNPNAPKGGRVRQWAMGASIRSTRFPSRVVRRPMSA